MNFAELFSFEGRVGRARYAIVFVVSLLAFILGATIIITALEAILPKSNYDTVGKNNAVVYTAIILWLVPTFWIWAANIVKRFHDTNRPGAWFLIFLIPLVGAIAAVAMFLVPGTPAENQYGPPVA